MFDIFPQIFASAKRLGFPNQTIPIAVWCWKKLPATLEDFSQSLTEVDENRVTIGESIIITIL